MLGTRPEAIKLAPVVRELAAHGASVRVLLTGQHRAMVDDLLAPLGLTPYVAADLRVMRHGQGLNDLAATLMSRLDEHWMREQPAGVVVQGDTTTAMCTTIAAFHRHLPVAHVEAGLRTGRRDDPFPEEVNRRLITAMASLHFAPTKRARDHLLDEGIAADCAVLTGNTSIDSLLWTRSRGLGASAFDASRGAKVLMTLHRRESQGARMRAIADALATSAGHLGYRIVVPMHASDAVRRSIGPVLRGRAGVCLVEPLPYVDFVATLADADLVVTDSGGVQEEAPALGIPVVVVRETSERMEAVDAGWAILAGTDAGEVTRIVERLLGDNELRRAMSGSATPFGDGHAAERIARELKAWPPPYATCAQPERAAR